MADTRSPFLAALQDRGFIHDATDLAALDEAAKTNAPLIAYIGFDCTAPSLHVGSLVQIMMLRWLQKTGHKPIVLLGGGTTKVGDPTGKDEARRLLSDEDIARNMTGIQRVFERFLHFGDSATDAIMVNNADWLDHLHYIPFLRDIGRHFSVNRMLAFDSVKLRLEREQPLSFLEFNYMILQSYDFLELFRRQGCVLQMGGSDQWGNIVSGVDLVRRVDGGHVHGLTSPLITNADGSKMGKTAKGAVWLNEDALPAYDYWQFWRNVQDADVGRFLRLFTELPLAEIARLEACEGQELNDAKKILANEATALCRGREAAAQAAETARRTFEEGAQGADLPTLTVTAAAVAAGIGVVDLFVGAGLAASKGEARRLIRQGGARLDGAAVADENAMLDPTLLTAGQPLKLSAGKKRHALVKLDA
ncbi:MAG: tyrosine--tRNA ligase [Sphingomonadales bacterium]